MKKAKPWDEQNKLNATFAIRLNRADIARIKKAAKEHKVSPSEFARRAILVIVEVPRRLTTLEGLDR